VNVYVKNAENVENGMLVIENVLANLVKFVENILEFLWKPFAEIAKNAIIINYR
jgi:hypothetical protein